MIHNARAALFAVAVYVAGVASAFAGDCITLKYAQQIADNYGVVLESLSGAQLKTAGEIFVASSGRDMTIKSAVLVALPDGGGLFAVGPDTNSLCVYGRLDARQWRVLRNSIFGTGA